MHCIMHLINKYIIHVAFEVFFVFVVVGVARDYDYSVHRRENDDSRHICNTSMI